MNLTNDCFATSGRSITAHKANTPTGLTDKLALFSISLPTDLRLTYFLIGRKTDSIWQLCLSVGELACLSDMAQRARPRASAFTLRIGTKPLIICWREMRAVEALALTAPTRLPRESITGTAIDRNPISSS